MTLRLFGMILIGCGGLIFNSRITANGILQIAIIIISAMLLVSSALGLSEIAKVPKTAEKD